MNLNRMNPRTGFTQIELIVIVAIAAMLLLLLVPRFGRRGCYAAPISCANNLKQVVLSYRQWSLDNNDKFPMQVSVTNGGAMEAVLAGDVATVFRVMSNELSTPKILFCPEDKKRIQATNFSSPDSTNRAFQNVYFANNSNVTYFVGLDADETFPNMFLAGDDNWLVGGEAGNVAHKGSPVTSGILPLWTNTPLAWSSERHKKKGNVGLADGSVQEFTSSKLAAALRNSGVATNRLAFP